MSMLESVTAQSSKAMSAIKDSMAPFSVAERGRKAATVAWKLAQSTGKVAWIAGTTFLVLGLPLIFVIEQEVSISDMIQNEQDEMQTILGTTS